MNRKLWSILLVLAVLTTAGCQSFRPFSLKPATETETVVKKNLFGFDGVPAREYLVGGGYMIRYQAQAEGELYIAEQNSNRLLATISLQAGEFYEVDYDIHNPELSENLEKLGMDPKKASFILYFVPR